MSETELKKEGLQTGDVLLTSGKGIFSSGIRAVTGAEVTHAAIILRISNPSFEHRPEGSLILVAEAVGAGISCASFDRFYNHHQINGVVVRRYHYATNEAHKDTAWFDAAAMEYDALNMTGAKYNTRGIVKYFSHDVLGIDNIDARDRQLDDTNIDEMFCSEFVSWLYRRRKIDLVETKTDQLTSPGDLFDTHKLKTIGAFSPAPPVVTDQNDYNEISEEGF